MYSPRIPLILLGISLWGCSRDESKEQKINHPNAVNRSVSRKESAKSFIAQRVSSSMMVPGKVTECYVTPKTDNSFTFSGIFVWSQTGENKGSMERFPVMAIPGKLRQSKFKTTQCNNIDVLRIHHEHDLSCRKNPKPSKCAT